MSEFVGLLLEHGSSGLIAALMLVMFIRKDNELTAERAARIADAQGYTKLALDLQKNVMDATTKLSDVFQAIRKDKP
ncbi:MAG: hypothetical protein KGL39_35945 [Patescibacteria group bacterium]|nr:hypothetical protein [Patescibacteria group bacterium]